MHFVIKRVTLSKMLILFAFSKLQSSSMYIGGKDSLEYKYNQYGMRTTSLYIRIVIQSSFVVQHLFCSKQINSNNVTFICTTKKGRWVQSHPTEMMWVQIYISDCSSLMNEYCTLCCTVLVVPSYVQFRKDYHQQPRPGDDNSYPPLLASTSLRNQHGGCHT